MRIPIALYLLAFAARAIAALAFPHPGYPDSAYYVDVAREIVAGNGLTIPVVWIFPEVGGSLPANPVLPVPSNAHWMPLASFVQVPFMLILGPGVFAATLPFLLIGSLAAPLTWLIARDAGLRPFPAASAGVLAAVPAFLLPYLAQQENFALIEVLTAGALYLASRGLRGDGRAFVAAGLLAGLATLARTDVGLVMVVLGLAFLWDRWRTRRPFGVEPPRPARISVKAAAGAVVGWLVVMGPWLARQLAVFGSLSPSSSSGKALWIRDFSEWNSITIPADPDHLMSWGAGPLLESRVTALGEALGIFIVLGAGIILFPLIVWGASRRWRDARFGPAIAYALLWLATSVILFAPHVPGGMFIHSAVGLLPHAYALAIEALAALSVALAARARSSDPERFSRILIMFVVGVVAVFAVVGTMTVHRTWAERRDRMLLAVGALDAAGIGQDERVMSIDAAGYLYLSGRPGVVIVNDPIATVRDVATAYGVRWIVVRAGRRRAGARRRESSPTTGPPGSVTLSSIGRRSRSTPCARRPTTCGARDDTA